jgi:hypothetical protein
VWPQFKLQVLPGLLQDNRFTGRFPRPLAGSQAWEKLVMLRLSNNQFKGKLPELHLGEVGGNWCNHTQRAVHYTPALQGVAV